MRRTIHVILGKFFLTGAVLSALLMLGCNQKLDQSSTIKKYKVIFTADEAGSISAFIDGKPFKDDAAAKDAVITFKAQAKNSITHEPDKWSITGSTLVEGGTDGSTFAKIKIISDTSIKVSFKEKHGTSNKNEASVSISQPSEGSITAFPALPAEKKIPKGTVITFKAEAKNTAAHEPDKWSIAGGKIIEGGTDGSKFAKVEINTDTKIGLTFKRKSYAINFGIKGGLGGSLTAKLDGHNFTTGSQAEYGKMIIFTASAPHGFKVDKWLINAHTVSKTEDNIYGLKVIENASVEVTFILQNLLLDEKAFTKQVGESETYKLIKSGSGNYTAEAEQPDIIGLIADKLNTEGIIKVNCKKEGSSRIKITDTKSGQVKYSGLFTVTSIGSKPPAPIEKYFSVDGLLYHVTDESAKHVEITSKISDTRIEEYSIAELHIPAQVIYKDTVFTVTGAAGGVPWGRRLKKIEVAAENQYLSSENGVLFNKDKSLLILYPSGKTDKEYNIPNSVTELGSHSFYMIMIGLTKVTLPPNLTKIGNQVFCMCIALKEISGLPSSLTEIGSEFLFSTKVTEIKIPEGITILKKGFLASASNLKKAEFPSTLQQIEELALSNCRKLTEIICKAENPPNIDFEAFKFIRNLNSITLKVPPASVNKYKQAALWKKFNILSL